MRLDAERSSDPDGPSDLRSFTWLETVDGGSTVLATGRVADVWLSVGTHEVGLVVTDSADQGSYASITLTVQ